MPSSQAFGLVILLLVGASRSQAVRPFQASNLTMRFDLGVKPEPLNVVISSASYEAIPNSSMSDDLRHWFMAIGFFDECLHRHGKPQYANLDDGLGAMPQKFLVREDFHRNSLGSCAETLVGGNHCRGFHHGITNEWFLGCSVEKTILRHHGIVKDGYNKGRQGLIEAAIAGGKAQGCEWPPATVEVLHGAGTKDATGSLYNHEVEVDGDVAYITVHRPTRRQRIST